MPPASRDTFSKHSEPMVSSSRNSTAPAVRPTISARLPHRRTASTPPAKAPSTQPTMVSWYISSSPARPPEMAADAASRKAKQTARASTPPSTIPMPQRISFAPCSSSFFPIETPSLGMDFY